MNRKTFAFKGDPIDFLRSQIIGRGAEFTSSVGETVLLNLDQVATSQSLKFIEDYIQYELLKVLGNPHNKTAHVGITATYLFNQARAVIADYLNAGPNHTVIPVGTGTTGAIERLHNIIGIHLASTTRAELEKYNPELVPQNKLPIAFVSELEHHSDFLNALEGLAEVVFIPLTEDEGVDLSILKNKLQDPEYQNRKKLGFFSATSNVTGRITPVYEIAKILKDNGADVFFDLAAYAPHEKIDLRPTDELFGTSRQKVTLGKETINLINEYNDPAIQYLNGELIIKANADELLQKINISTKVSDVDKLILAGGLQQSQLIDGVYFSGHKLLGGPGATGILAIHNRIYNTALPPAFPAGDTVIHVSKWHVEYDPSIAGREGPGTGGSIQLYKAALALQVLDWVTIDRVRAEEKKLAQPVYDLLVPLHDQQKINFYGNPDPELRVPTFSFNVRYKDGYLHPNFIAKALSDYFGVQTRAGCSCAGVLGHNLLDITEEKSDLMLRAVTENSLFGVKPGWVRLHTPYWLTSNEVTYTTLALKTIIEHGHKLLSLYKFNPYSGEWLHTAGEPEQLTFGLAHALQSYQERQNNTPEITTTTAIDEFTYTGKLLQQYQSRAALIESLPEIDGSKLADLSAYGAPLKIYYHTENLIRPLPRPFTSKQKEKNTEDDAVWGGAVHVSKQQGSRKQ